MKTKTIRLFGILVLLLMATLVPMTFAVKPDYDTITEGEVMYSAGHWLEGDPIPTGFDEYGYNYQGHMFKGAYFNSYAGKDGFPAWTGDDEAYLVENPTVVGHWAWPYRDVDLTMKWNDAWLSNVDRDDDGLLDRHWGYAGYPDSGAWLTNHQAGEYEDNGEIIKWNYFVKIVTPSPINGDYETNPQVGNDGIWYTTGDEEIGLEIWGAFAIVQQVENDPGLESHGVLYLSDVSAGFGNYPAY